MPDLPADVPRLLRALLADDPGRPRLTWYGPDGERVELSAKVLDNWVAKTANLLVDELDVGPGSEVAVVLPPHWRTAVWLLAIWSTGGCAVVLPAVPEVLPRADLLVAADPQVLRSAPAGARQIAVALPALATSFGPALPLQALDYALEVRAFGDVFVPLVAPVPSDPALEIPGHPLLTHADLLPAAARAAEASNLPQRARLLTGAGPDGVVEALLAPLVRLGSVVYHHDLAGLAANPTALAALRAQEGITSPGPPDGRH